MKKRYWFEINETVVEKSSTIKSDMLPKHFDLNNWKLNISGIILSNFWVILSSYKSILLFCIVVNNELSQFDSLRPNNCWRLLKITIFTTARRI